MKIAALILAWSDPVNFRTLTTFLCRSGVDCFVHVDSKVDVEEFRVENIKGSNFFIIENRISIFWRGFTMIEAMITLLQRSLDTYAYDYFMFLSDNSLPVAPASQIIETFSAGGDFIQARPVTDELARRYYGFYMFDSPATQVRWIPVLDRTFDLKTIEKIERLKTLYRRGKKAVSRLMHGPQWMALNRSSALQIMKSWNEDEWLKSSFEFSEVPDESYFHTILSEISPPEWKPFMHVDWSGNPPPRVFTQIKEVYDIRNTGALFVRKVNLQRAEAENWVDKLCDGRY